MDESCGRIRTGSSKARRRGICFKRRVGEGPRHEPTLKNQGWGTRKSKSRSLGPQADNLAFVAPASSRPLLREEEVKSRSLVASPARIQGCVPQSKRSRSEEHTSELQS